MAGRKSGLGRGLDALLPTERPDRGYTAIALDAITPNPSQPRLSFDEESIEMLAASIREVGILQPVVVRPPDTSGVHALVAGERRWRAARSAGLKEIPAIIRDESGAGSDLTEALIENVQREDLGPLEEAAAYRQLLEDFGWTHEQVAARVGKSRPSVTNALRLLQLPPAIQGMLERNELAPGHARPLLSLDDVAYARHIAEQVVAEGWSVRQVEEAVKARVEGGSEEAKRAPRPTMPRPAALIELEDRLSEHLGSKVKITSGKRGGRVVVGYRDLDDLERIYRRFFGG
jgi:ParB family chromosome partitioning protein